MKKGMLISVLAVMAAFFFAGAVWGQKNSPPGSFSGTITRVDLANKEIVVKSNKAQATFQWNDETRVNGSGEGKLNFEDLRQGMTVTVLYRGGNQSRVANRIDVTATISETSTGMEFPFECGLRVC